MKYTVFETPVMNILMSWLSSILLTIFGWKVVGTIPDIPKFVIIAAPHTSNLDGFIAVATGLAMKQKNKINWLLKGSAFKGLLKPVLLWFGALPVDRSKSNDFVKHAVSLFQENKKFFLIVPPEGTRDKVKYWKTGFYYIARGAGVPVLLAFVDYKKKETGVGPLIHLTDNVDEDMKKIMDFYSGVTPRHPEKSIHGSNQ